MAAATAIIMAGAAVASTGMAISKTAKANKAMKEAQRKIDGFQHQELRNTLEGVAVPQQIFNLETQQLQRSVANAQDMATMAGARGMAILPGLQQAEFEQQQRINANLEDNLYRLSLAKAQEDARIQQMQEQRENQQLAGYQNQYGVAQGMKNTGQRETINGIMAIGSTLGSAIDGAVAGRNSSAAGGMGQTALNVAADKYQQQYVQAYNNSLPRVSVEQQQLDLRQGYGTQGTELNVPDGSLNRYEYKPLNWE